MPYSITMMMLNDLNDYLNAAEADWPYETDRPIYSVEEGRKYFKITYTTRGESSRAVHSFVVKADTEKFRKGDILKAATYKAPAMNFARGNVLDEDWPTVRWMGIF